jgi:hypothetical protein
MRSFRLSPPPVAIRKATLDNLALLLASLLPWKATYQELANRLPSGKVLIILPNAPSPNGRP